MVQVRDLTGTADHYNVRIVSGGFAGMAPLDRHRLVYKAVSEAMKDGRLHALEIRADVP
jgi:stress-induced morphogen